MYGREHDRSEKRGEGLGFFDNISGSSLPLRCLLEGR